ncbi:putative glutathione S-transferase, partial [Cucurbita argyrosperma subsp. argyrosperma]
MKKVFMNEGKLKEEGIEEAKENLKHLEEELKAGGKRFFGGEVIGFVDIALGWLANLPSVLEEVIGLSLITQQTFPFLSKWTHEFANAPIINQHWPPKQQLVTNMTISTYSKLNTLVQFSKLPHLEYISIRAFPIGTSNSNPNLKIQQ